MLLVLRLQNDRICPVSIPVLLLITLVVVVVVVVCLGQSRVDAALVLSDSPTLSFEDLLGISYQVAQGMDFLASKNVGCLSRTPSQYRHPPQPHLN